MRLRGRYRWIARFVSIPRQLHDAALPLLLAILGFAIGSDTLAVLGVLFVVVVVSLHLWQRHCLDGVGYHRRFARDHIDFGETVELELEITNDKPLPVSCLRIEDEFPDGLTIDDLAGTRGLGVRQLFVQVLPLSPYERVRRSYVVHGDQRGEHRFGPAVMTSGDPLGRRTRSVEVVETAHLLVFPKLFAVAPNGIASRVLLGDARMRSALVTDPSRISGVRQYVSGDPLRHVDWRATARVGTLLIRSFDATAHQRVAVLLDTRIPGKHQPSGNFGETEFAISVAASLVAEFARRRIPVGLFATGYSGGLPVALAPSSAEGAYRAIMESLAKMVPHGRLALEDMIAAADRMTAGQTSFVVVAADFSQAALPALADARRRHAVSAVHLETDLGTRPPPTQLDAVLRARYVDDWHLSPTLELSQ